MESRRRNFFIVAAIVVGGKIIDAVIGDAVSRLFDQVLARARLDGAAMISALDHFWWGALATVTVWGALEFSYWLARRRGNSVEAPRKQIETRLRLRRDPSGTHQYLQVAQSNIDRWQQVVVHMDFSGEGGARKQPAFHVDTLAITFAEPVDYERPIFETFGHEMPGYSFYSLGKSGALFQFVGALDTPVIEVWFPPLGHYERAQELNHPDEG